MNEFDCWFAECVFYGASEYIAPDEYVWSLNDCDKWKQYYNLGFTPKEAVYAEFRSN